jgi:hypothetical protein
LDAQSREGALAASALRLASELDAGAGMAAAAIARELRTTMTTLMESTEQPKEDGLDDLAARRAARHTATGS